MTRASETVKMEAPTNGGSIMSSIFDSKKTYREKVNRNDDYYRGHGAGKKKRK